MTSSVNLNSVFSPKKISIESNIPAWDNVPAQTQQLALAVGESGSAAAPPERTFLMVHGITANLHFWDVIARALLQTSPEPLRIIALDLRGRGDSDKPDQPYSMAVHAADIAGLLNALGISEPINYVGHSLGAHIGTVFASSYPERVRRLVLIDGGARLPSDVGESIAPALRRVGQLFASYEEYVAPLKASGVWGEWNEDIERIYRYDSHSIEAGVMSKVSKPAIDQELLHIGAFYRSVNSLYPAIKAPTLIARAPVPVAQPLSPFLPSETIEIMTRTIGGGARVVEVAGTNHYTIVTQPSPEMIAGILG